MWSRRIERVNELLLREISRIVTERQDPDVGFITFTGVQVTEDLMQAKVFYSVLGSEEERARTADALVRLRHEFYREMRRLESLKRIPALEFIYDATPARAARVYEILQQIHREDEGTPPPPPPRRAASKDAHARRTQRKKPR